MSNISGLLGTAGGMKGTGVDGPGSANVLNPATTVQAGTQYENAQDALQKQSELLWALQAQNGLGNQSSVYNQLQGVANGTGPNPAQAQLANATGANIANQAALMAGQRGSNANAGMIARQAAMQGANTQQEAAGQAAALQAQQSLGALGNMGNLASTQAAQQAQATGAYNQAAQGEQGQILNAIAAQNNANVGMQSNLNNANTSMINQTATQQAAIGGQGAQGAGSAMSSMFATGGQVTESPLAAPVDHAMQAGPLPQGPQSSFAKFLNGTPAASPQNMSPEAQSLAELGKGANALGSAIGKGISAGYNYLTSPSESTMPAPSSSGQTGLDSLSSMQDSYAEGGQVPAMVSPGEQYLPPKDVKKVAKGANPLAVGEKIPGKPKFKGNDYRNDTVPKTLEEGGIVIPNEIMQMPNAHWHAMKFVHATIAKNRKSLPKKSK